MAEHTIISDISRKYAVDVYLQIFTAPFDPANPLANRIALLDDFNDDFDKPELQAGKECYFVTQPFNAAANGEFFYIFSPPALPHLHPLVITYAISGSWFFPPTTGMLDINWSSGMIFDSESPPVTNAPDGEMVVEFFDCFTGEVRYDLGASDRLGVVPIERIVNDAVPLCETLTQGPDKPGPL